MKYKFEDKSGDRKHFTIVPNYILNHSSAIDKALYLEIKRAAGDDGLCFMTQETLCKKLGVGKVSLRKSLDYLIKKKWIEYTGKTAGKTRPIDTYKVNDIWKQNTEYYANKEISSKTDLSKDTTQKEKDTTQNSNMIRPETALEEEPNLRRTIKKNTAHKKYSSLKDIQEPDLIEIATKYHVSLGFVKLQFEKLANYCEAKGRRYKNYKSALRNFVLGDMQRTVERRQDDPKRGIDARSV